MNRSMLTVVLLIMWATTAYSAPVVDLKFYDSSGDDYHTVTLISDIKRHYGFELSRPKVLLIEATNLNNTEYKKQDEALSHLGHEVEQHQVLFVVASPSEVNKDSYHATIEAAKALSLQASKFRVRLLNHTGRVLKSADKAISASELKKWFELK